MTPEEIEEIEELIAWNYSFGISPLDTLKELRLLEQIHLFNLPCDTKIH